MSSKNKIGSNCEVLQNFFYNMNQNDQMCTKTPGPSSGLVFAEKRMCII